MSIIKLNDIEYDSTPVNLVFFAEQFRDTEIERSILDLSNDEFFYGTVFVEKYDDGSGSIALSEVVREKRVLKSFVHCKQSTVTEIKNVKFNFFELTYFVGSSYVIRFDGLKLRRLKP